MPVYQQPDAEHPSDPYFVDPADIGVLAFEAFGIEQQANIVEQWFHTHVVVDPATGAWSLDSPAATADPAFVYIAQNLRLGKV